MWRPYEFGSSEDVVVGTVGRVRGNVFRASRIVVRCDSVPSETRTMDIPGIAGSAMTIHRMRRAPPHLRTWLRSRGLVMIKGTIRTTAVRISSEGTQLTYSDCQGEGGDAWVDSGFRTIRLNLDGVVGDLLFLVAFWFVRQPSGSSGIRKDTNLVPTERYLPTTTRGPLRRVLFLAISASVSSILGDTGSQMSLMHALVELMPAAMIWPATGRQLVACRRRGNEPAYLKRPPVASHATRSPLETMVNCFPATGTVSVVFVA